MGTAIGSSLPKKGVLLHEVLRNDSLKFRSYLVEAARTGIPPNEKLFAVDLDEIEKGNANNAKDFLDRTELTNKQKELIRKILSRISGRSSSGAAFLLDTVMGGGKTHTLGYLYYMLKYRSVSSARDEIREILNELELSGIPEAEIVLVNGLNLDPHFPLDKQSKLKEFFEKTATKEGVIKTIESKGRPVVFIIDELVEYLNKRGGGAGLPYERQGLYESDLSYLRTLIEGVVDTGTSAFVMTIPSDAVEENKYNKIVRLFKVVIRQAEIVHPIDEKADLPRIIKKQFVERMERDLPEEAAAWIRNVYRRMGMPVDEEQYKTYYPFNPHLINDIFVNQFSQYKNFQKTRMTLTILSKVVADIIKRAEKEEFPSPFINAGDIDLRSIKDTITSDNIFEMQGLQTVVNNDILTEGLGALERRLATTVYLYSLNNVGEKQGADHRQLFDANPSELMGPAEYKSAIDAYFKRQTKFLHYVPENEKYKFLISPNIWSLIRREAEKIKDYSKQLGLWFSKLEMGDEVEVIYSEMPSANLQRYKVNLVVVPPTAFGDDTNLEDDVREFANKRGLFPSSTGYENGIVLLYPSSVTDIRSLAEAAREAIAVQELEKMHKRDEKMLKGLKDIESEIFNRFTNSVMGCYTKVLFKRKLETITKDLHLTERKEEAYANSIKELLSKEEKVFFMEGLGKLNVEDLFKRLLGARIEVSVKQAYDGISKNTNLPFLSYRAFQRAIQLGIENECIGLASGQTDQKERSDFSILDAGVSPQEGHYILSKEWLEHIKERIKGPLPPPGPNSSTTIPPGGSGTGTVVITSQEPSVVEVQRESVLRDPGALIQFMKKVELAWKTSNKRDQKYELSFFISSSGGYVELKSDLSKIAYVKQLIENLLRAFDKGDYKVRVVVKLDKDIATQMT